MRAGENDKFSKVNILLKEAYGQKNIRERDGLPPLDELIATILSQNTTDVNSDQAYRAMRNRFPTWEAVMEADISDLEDAIRFGGLAHLKAERIQSALREIKREHGRLSLDFLADWPVEEIRRYLTRFKGVGMKTASCVCLFSLKKPCIPVDTHVHRVSRRLGLVGERDSPDKTQSILEAQIPSEDMYGFHINMILHGRQVCKAQKPRCWICPLQEVCDHYAVKVAFAF
ncbi:MAG: endonuclease III domain-containing protein [bacterium]